MPWRRPGYSAAAAAGEQRCIYTSTAHENGSGLVLQVGVLSCAGLSVKAMLEIREISAVVYSRPSTPGPQDLELSRGEEETVSETLCVLLAVPRPGQRRSIYLPRRPCHGFR